MSMATAIPADWLDEEITVEEAERRHPGITDERVARHPELGRPFGGLSPQWEQLKAQMQPGDQLWTFASKPDSWRHLAGRAGVALIRDGAAIAVITTLMN
jgi:hypothetical protein